MTKIGELKILLVEACKKIYEYDLVERGEGNISIKIPGKDEMIITPSGTDYNNPLPNQMVHISFLGEKFDKSLKPSSEFFIHTVLTLPH